MLVLSQVLSDIARAIVDHPDSVNVTESSDTDGNVLLVLSVAQEDVGMVIGRHGKIAKAIRTVLKAAANSAGKKVTVEIK